jgi:hypothetical protein
MTASATLWAVSNTVGKNYDMLKRSGWRASECAAATIHICFHEFMRELFLKLFDLRRTKKRSRNLECRKTLQCSGTRKRGEAFLNVVDRSLYSACGRSGIGHARFDWKSKL